MSTFSDDTGLEKGMLAPHFTAETLSGETVTLADYARKMVSFIFISPHCRPCVDKLPTLNTLALKAKQAGVDLIVVSTDGEKAETAALAEKYQLHVPMLFAPQEENSFAHDYKADATPCYCMINREGQVVSAGLFEMRWEKQLVNVWSQTS